MAGLFYFLPAVSDSGLALAYLASIYAGLATGLWSFFRSYGRPRGWRPRPAYMGRLTMRALPLATAADDAEPPRPLALSQPLCFWVRCRFDGGAAGGLWTLDLWASSDASSVSMSLRGMKSCMTVVDNNKSSISSAFN